MTQLKDLLEDSHKDLHQWFLYYQECILLDLDEMARSALQVFYQILSMHLTFENDFLLKGENPSTRWSHTVYRKEHTKLLLKLENMIQYTDDYCLLKGRSKRLAMIDLIEHQQRFYHLLEHHEEREESDLFLFIADDFDASLWQIPYDQLLDSHNDLKMSIVRLLSVE